MSAEEAVITAVDQLHLMNLVDANSVIMAFCLGFNEGRLDLDRDYDPFDGIDIPDDYDTLRNILVNMAIKVHSSST